MKLLKHIRSRSKIKSAEAQIYDSLAPPGSPGFSIGFPTSDIAARLPPPVLEAIFAFVCPHVLDETFDSLEDSMIEDGCMLCDMRDLAHCAAVCRSWTVTAKTLLYLSVRIDAVHYCEREVELAEKRKRRSFFDRNADPKDVPQERLQLFSRTVREDGSLGVHVQLLKMPYMTRETCKADLARTVSVLPNLRYVDLPEGFFSDDPSSHSLKHELQARCADVRKMKYVAGSEQSFTLLTTGHHWQALQVLELSHLNIEPTTALHVLGSLPTLHELKLTDLTWLNDTIFEPVATVPAFPPLQKLTLANSTKLTAAGLSTYFARPEVREVFSSLTLIATGIQPSTLYRILANAPHLTHLSIAECVTRSFPLDPVPPLASSSLRTLFYEITSASTPTYAAQNPAKTHYTYLTTSLHAAALPALRELYVRDTDFPETLILTPPAPAFAQSPSFSRRGGGFNQQLAVYSKGLDELEWNFTNVLPPKAPGKRGSFAPPRPISAYKAGVAAGLGSPGWGGDTRKSVVVGNGFGGFLAVPSGDGPPGSPGQRGSRADLWR